MVSTCNRNYSNYTFKLSAIEISVLFWDANGNILLHLQENIKINLFTIFIQKEVYITTTQHISFLCLFTYIWHELSCTIE